MGEDEIVALPLNSEELLHEIEVRRESGNEGHTQDEKHRPYFVLDAEPTPPVCRVLPHVAMSSCPDSPYLYPLQ